MTMKKIFLLLFIALLGNAAIAQITDYSIFDKKFNFYVGIDNLTDVKPPFGLLGTASGDPYDTFGRYVYAGFKANF